jgi:hypothetical protein
MNPARSSDSVDTSAKSAPVPSRRNLVEERDWYASSRDLAEGLVVQEIDDTFPFDLPPSR